jgi:triosephosphate isomerase
MHEIFINLKRFDVPKDMGGICLQSDPQKWIEDIITDTVKFGLGKLEDVNITYILPEGLILSANNKLKEFKSSETENINIGIQGVFRDDVSPGGNFGAFSTNRPASAMKNLGCTWTMNGHSEERLDKFMMLCLFNSNIQSDPKILKRANDTVSLLLNKENIAALKQGLDVLFCVGETAEERGEGSFDEQKPRIEAVLRDQILIGLKDVEPYLGKRKIVIGYEPRWAIGPGKVPPGAEYIGFVSAFIKEITNEMLGVKLPVVYGGGLKEENAKMIAGIETIDGGLVALTKFTGDIAFEPEGLKIIIETYLS